MAAVLPSNGIGGGGILGRFAERRPRFAQGLKNNANALTQFGLGLLSGSSRSEGWANAAQGLAYGQQADQAARDRTKAEEEQAAQDEAVNNLLMSEEFQSLPAEYRTLLQNDRELARSFLASDLTRRTTPAATPDPFTLSPGEQRFDGNGNPIAALPAAAPDPTGNMQDYEAYAADESAAGRVPLGRLEWTQRTRQTGGPPAPDAGLQAGLDAREAATWGTILEAGNTAATLQADLGALRELSAVAPSGPIAGRLAQMFPGFSTAGDAFQSIVLRLAPSLRVPGSGSTSDIEYQGMLQSLPTLVMQPQARDAIISMMDAKASIEIERAAIIQDYRNRDISDVEARRRLAEVNARSIMTPALQALIGGPESVVRRSTVQDQTPQNFDQRFDPNGWVEVAPGIRYRVGE